MPTACGQVLLDINLVGAYVLLLPRGGDLQVQQYQSFPSRMDLDYIDVSCDYIRV